MTIFHALILGIVEGLTEFVPISSTFHLLITSRLLNLNQSDFLKFFEVIIQFGAILSILTLYGQKLKTDRSLRNYLFISFVPTAIIGVLLYPLVKNVFFESLYLQLFSFATIGVVFLILERLIRSQTIRGSNNLSALTPRWAILIGIIQASSLMPGVSRSGAVIIGMLTLGFSRIAAAEYAFILSLPTISAAAALDLYKNLSLLTTFTPSQYLSLFVGLITSYLSAYFVMQWFIRYLSTHTLALFGYYRLILTALILLLMT